MPYEIDPFEELVSILIQPEGRMQLADERGVRVDDLIVSILIQPEGRMQHGGVVTYRLLLTVSILIQPEGRMQLCPLAVTSD